jgi:FkbM family methyltransferase
VSCSWALGLQGRWQASVGSFAWSFGGDTYCTLRTIASVATLRGHNTAESPRARGRDDPTDRMAHAVAPPTTTLLAVLSALLPLASCGSARHHQIVGIKHDFVAMVARVARERASAGRPPPKVALLDVGANAGTFSQAMMKQLQLEASHIRPRLIMFEPQPQFREHLGALAARWQGEHVAAAAWKEAANLTFHLNANNSEGATLASDARNDRVTAASRMMWVPITVPAVDLAAYLHHKLPSAAARDANASIAFLKLDVEGAEYDLLSRLISTRALCRLSFLLIEWHLHNLATEKRATGLAMKEGLKSVLASTCGTPPKIVHDDMPLNNYQNIDGLPTPAQKARLVDAFKAGMAAAVLREQEQPPMNSPNLQR